MWKDYNYLLLWRWSDIVMDIDAIIEGDLITIVTEKQR